MIELTPEQQRAYARFIAARNRVGLGAVRPSSKYSWVPHRDYSACLDVTGMNHPLFVVNDEWMEYKEASEAWWKLEPRFREDERMRMTRGDYGAQDSWDDRNQVTTGNIIKFGDEK